MKQKYINDLKEYLESKFVIKEDIDKITEEYIELYDEAHDAGLEHDEIVKKLGSPKFIYYSLKDDLNKEYKGSKITGLMVFISLILFFVVGQAFNLWAYSWMFFFLIPITAMLAGNKNRKKLPGIVVFISVSIYMILGMGFGLWHPSWLVFLLIPLAGIIVSNDDKSRVVGMIPFITVIIYIILGYMDSVFYLYAWPIFLLIPLFGVIFIEDKLDRIILISTLLLSIAGYYIIGFTLNEWVWSLLLYLVPISYAIYKKHIKIEIELFNNVILGISIVVILALYLIISLLTGGWAYTWVLLMLIPMIGIYSETKFKYIVSYMPFISVILFYVFGYFIKGGFAYSWLFFLLIPMSGILFPKKKKNDNEEVVLDYDDDYEEEYD